MPEQSSFLRSSKEFISENVSQRFCVSCGVNLSNNRTNQCSVFAVMFPIGLYLKYLLRFSNEHRTGELNSESETTLGSVKQSVEVKLDKAMNAQRITSNKNEATIKYKETIGEEHRSLRVRPEKSIVKERSRRSRRNKQRSTFTVKTSCDASRRVQSASTSQPQKVCVSQRPKTSVGTSRISSKDNKAANDIGKLPDIKPDSLKADLSSMEGSSHSGLSDLDGSEGSVRRI